MCTLKKPLQKPLRQLASASLSPASWENETGFSVLCLLTFMPELVCLPWSLRHNVYNYVLTCFISLPHSLLHLYHPVLRQPALGWQATGFDSVVKRKTLLRSTLGM